MKPNILVHKLAVFALFVSLVSGCATTNTLSAPTPSDALAQMQFGSGALSVGVARVEITPPIGTPLAGYSKRKGKPSVGVLDPVYVRAMSLHDGQDTAVLVSADILVFPPKLVKRLRRACVERFDLPEHAFVFAATHTHSGPGAIGEHLYAISFGTYDGQRVQALEQQIFLAIERALANQEAVQWAIHTESLPDNIQENRFQEGGAVDTTLSVFLARRQDKQLKVALVNMAAHPTNLSTKNFMFSGDFPGMMAQSIEAHWPEAICLFFNGAAGSTRLRRLDESSGMQRAERAAHFLSERVLASVKQAKWRKQSDLVVWGGPVVLPTPKMGLKDFPLPWLGRRLGADTAFQNYVALEEVVFVPLLGEMTAALGLPLREKLERQEVTPVLIGYADAYLGYVVSEDQSKQDSYESDMTWYGPTFGEQMIQQMLEDVQLYNKERAA